ncbi:MAG TPA: glutamine-hydrolyzing GMP synthase, partial [bacterium (Candidatus Stahlbacteria)]|nr:glutamine-hydrolyzing GMP synthase [Candidatus Stahlbacteria bacterium]
MKRLPVTHSDSSRPKGKLIIIDFGSQYTQLIARRIRELRVYTEIRSCRTPAKKIIDEKPTAIVLSGSPGSINRAGPGISRRIVESGIPVLGICYGMQVIAQLMGGRVRAREEREYGRTEIEVVRKVGVFSRLPKRFVVWMSHGDSVVRVPPGFRILARSKNIPIAAFGSESIYGVQFHPEV